LKKTSEAGMAESAHSLSLSQVQDTKLENLRRNHGARPVNVVENAPLQMPAPVTAIIPAEALASIMRNKFGEEVTRLFCFLV
jgi:hypothetical protein